MKLYTSTTSPTARAIILTALSQNKDDLQLAYADPWTTPPALTAENPFSQVPTLITDDGIHIYNTLTIADYLFDHPFRSAAQTAVAGYATALLEQIIKAYSLARFQPEGTAEHPHIARARAAATPAGNGLPLCRTAPPRALPAPGCRQPPRLRRIPNAS